MRFKVCNLIGEICKMSRSIISSVKAIFESLEAYIGEDEKHRIIDSIRIIEKPNKFPEENMEFFLKSKIKSKIRVNSNKYLVGIEYNSRQFILIPEKGEILDSYPPGLIRKTLADDEEISEGIRILLYSEKLVTINKKLSDLSLNLIEKIYALEALGNKVFYKLDQIDEFFIPFEIWEIETSIFDINNGLDLYKIYSIYLLQSNEDERLMLDFTAETKNELEFLLIDPNSIYISEVIYKAITANHWEHCFLEMYKCIENLYMVYHIDLLSSQLTDNDLSIAMGLDKIGFRSTEKNDVKKLFEKLFLSVEKLSELKKLLEKDNGENEVLITDEKMKEKMAEKLYLIRCSIAHLKYKHNHPNYTVEEWNQILMTMGTIIKELYSIYGNKLSNLVS